MARKNDASVLVSNQKIANQLSRRMTARAEAEATRLAKHHRQPKVKPSKNLAKPSEGEKWHVEILCLIGLTDREVTDIVFQGRAKTTGVVAGMIRRKGWRAIKYDNAIDRLIAMDANPVRGMEGMAESECAKYSKAHLDAFLHRRGIVPEQQLRLEKSRAMQRWMNDNASALTRASNKGDDIPDWIVMAGVRAQQEFNKLPGSVSGGIGGVFVDGGMGDAHDRAMRGLRRAEKTAAIRQCVLDAFMIEMTGPTRWAIVDWVAIRDMPIEAFEFPARFPAEMKAEPVKFLRDALEPLAHYFKTAPAGVYAKSPSAEDRARYEAAMAAEGARRKRLFGG